MARYACSVADGSDADRCFEDNGTVDDRPVKNLVCVKDGVSQRVAIKFPADEWSEDEARSECSKRDGTFEGKEGDGDDE